MRSIFSHFEVPTVSVLHLSTLLFAYLWGVRHSKSAHQALSITVSLKVGRQHKTASRYHCGTSLVPLFATFRLRHISPAGCKKSCVCVSEVSVLTCRSVTLMSLIHCQLVKTHWSPIKLKPIAVPTNNVKHTVALFLKKTKQTKLESRLSHALSCPS